MSQLIPLNDLLHSALDNTHSACMVFVFLFCFVLFFVTAAAAFPASCSHGASLVRGTNIGQVSIKKIVHAESPCDLDVIKLFLSKCM